MNLVVKNILAVVAGIVVGSIVNMGIIMISGSIIPPPEGADNTTMEGLKASIHLFEAKHFIFPFLAHALGTLVGAVIATKIAATRKMTMALLVGFFFLMGGTANIVMLGGPMWFTALDIIVAYMPMAYVGYMLGKK
ncbi:hypothetical protein CLV90_1743 [Maribacter spongiicola]|uniref:Uncharacterized protein n=1 Tax=Maribacter spongiicola TaxID=1206753 RepID=A0A4R7K3K4_9FLAO|nr:hypothetical protein [Maribacter spongiicola]TDT44667.1 hypothetical protein CLV90_1743 [Maribacter spongiicola]